MKTNSHIYEGSIRHRRFVEHNREFKYRIFMMYVDLAEIESAFNNYWLWSTKGPNVAWMRRADYLDGQPRPLSDSVRSVVQDQLGVTPDGPIRLLTNFRYFGFGINPISLYYCFNKNEQLEFVVAEVTNTPWGEKQTYVLDGRSSPGKIVEAVSPKLLHVSPFLEMEYEYRFQVGQPDENLSVHIANHRILNERAIEDMGDDHAVDRSCGVAAGSQAEFDATLVMKRQPLSSRNLARVLCRYPLVTAQVFGKIHWQAFQLWIKGVAVKKHPKHLQQTDSGTSSESNSSNQQDSGNRIPPQPTESKPSRAQPANSMERHETNS